MTKDILYMNLCLELAAKGLGNTNPNPMVGSVIVLDDEIIGEGFHEAYGKAHAEVNAINSVQNKKLLSKSTLYVNLEPCSHFGKTPPCVDLIIKHKIPRVFIGSKDSNSLVSGQGIKKLTKAGVTVNVGILEEECRNLNKRFFTFHEQKRPYIILKWAQTIDGFIDKTRPEKRPGKPIQITNMASKKLVHKWRSQEDAIMVGTNTVLMDNPKLTVRSVDGVNPRRVTIDENLRIPAYFNILDDTVQTIVYTSKKVITEKEIDFVKINFNKNILPQIMKDLFEKKVQSLFVEGGAELLNSFIKEGLWDEARVFVADKKIRNGVKAPVLKQKPMSEKNIKGNFLLLYEK